MEGSRVFFMRLVKVLTISPHDTCSNASDNEYRSPRDRMLTVDGSMIMAAGGAAQSLHDIGLFLIRTFV